jgi:mono/diheme cytochrome c family protein
MRRSTLLATCVISLMTVAYGARLTAQSSEDPNNDPRYDELAKVPEKYRAKQNPLSNDPEAVKAGAILFEQHCAECHGVGAVGGKKAPSLRAPQVQEASDGTIFWILSNGIVRKKMPVWSKLPEPQRWQLVSYIKSLGRAATENSVENKIPTATQEHSPSGPEGKQE